MDSDGSGCCGPGPMIPLSIEWVCGKQGYVTATYACMARVWTLFYPHREVVPHLSARDLVTSRYLLLKHNVALVFQGVVDVSCERIIQHPVRDNVTMRFIVVLASVCSTVVLGTPDKWVVLNNTNAAPGDEPPYYWCFSFLFSYSVVLTCIVYLRYPHRISFNS